MNYKGTLSYAFHIVLKQNKNFKKIKKKHLKKHLTKKFKKIKSKHFKNNLIKIMGLKKIKILHHFTYI